MPSILSSNEEVIVENQAFQIIIIFDNRPTWPTRFDSIQFFFKIKKNNNIKIYQIAKSVPFDYAQTL